LYSVFITSTGGHRDLAIILGYWTIFSCVEMIGAWVAFRLDKEDPKLIGWLLLQRFVYRQLLYYVVVKSLDAAIRGSFVGWGKFERKGTVQEPTPQKSSVKRAPPIPEDEPVLKV
jgi:hypothetical protein